MEQFWMSMFGTLIGTGIGGGIVYLAFQKAVEDIVDDKLKPVWCKIDNFKNDYVLKEVFQVTNAYLEKNLKDIKSMCNTIITEIRAPK